MLFFSYRPHQHLQVMIRYSPFRTLRTLSKARTTTNFVKPSYLQHFRLNSSKSASDDVKDQVIEAHQDPLKEQNNYIDQAEETPLQFDSEFHDILARLENPTKVENDTFNLTNDVDAKNDKNDVAGAGDTNFTDKNFTDTNFQLLNDFINQEYSSDSTKEFPTESKQESMQNITTLTEEILADQKDDGFKPVDIDQNDEKMFDLDFLGVNKSESDSKIIENEKQLFQNIFNSYMEPTLKEQTKKQGLDWDVKESIYNTKQKIDNMLLKQQHHELAKVSKRLREELFEKTKEALAPTLAYINSISNSVEMVDFFESIVSHWTNQLQTNDISEEIYLNDFLKQYNDFTTIHEEFVEKMALESQTNPHQPGLNVFTFPTVFNGILNTTAFKLYDGQLCLTLFNILKKDLNLYSIACNQETYNEILRILWIYNGKSNLYTIEMVFMEMKNNGFNGDLVTFNTLKQIIIDYHSMKMGKLEVNKSTGLPIWSKEDDKRINNLERNLRYLVQSIYKEEGL